MRGVSHIKLALQAVLVLLLAAATPQRSSVAGRISPSGAPRLVLNSAATGSSRALYDAHGWSRMLEKGELRIVQRDQKRGRTLYQQYYEGFPVVGGRLVVREQGSIFAHSSLVLWQGRPSLASSIGQGEAVAIAVAKVKSGMVVGESSVETVVLSVSGLPRLCQRVSVTTAYPAHLWEWYIDASDGSVRLIEDRLKRFDGRGLVFDPDPKSVTQNDGLSDEEDAAEAIPEEAYSEVTLPDLTLVDDSLYVLTGPWADTSPTANRASSAEGEFLFDREDDRFEEVMGYYHIDRQARYIVDLGFDVPGAQQLAINGLGDDASFFNPQTGIITTGTGGVDDAEDADVLLHEYAHALIEQIIPDWRGGETGLLVEGHCDYLAGDYSTSTAPDFNPMQVYNWDGHNEFWGGRVLNSDYTYDEIGDLDVHEAGQLWSSLLTEVRLTGSRDEWNSVVLDYIAYLADSASVPDAAEALLESDKELTLGAFRRAILAACESRGILPPGIHSPMITHTPPRDTEDEVTPIRMTAQIESEIPLDPENLLLIYRFGDDDPETTRFEQVDGTLYQTELPAPERETDVGYYIFAADEAGVFATDPPDAPDEQHHFYIGPDRFAPVIVGRDSIPDTVFPEGDLLFGAVITDNIAVSEAKLLWYDSRLTPLGNVDLTPVESEPDRMTGRIIWHAEPNERIYYRLRVTDSAARANTVQTALSYFAIRQEAAVDDFERVSSRWQLDGWTRISDDSYSGTWSLHDRVIADTTAPREAVARLDESWRFAGMISAGLIFAERHIFDQRVMEHGVVEVSPADSEDWETVLTLSGIQGNWVERELNLDRFAVRNAPPINIRFRTITPVGARSFYGWVVDELRLRVGNRVAAIGESSPVAGQFILGEPFPNPANSRVSFYVTAPKSTEIYLIDLAGRSVLALPVPTGKQSLSFDLEALPAGHYLIKFRDAPGSRPVVLLK